MPEFKMDFTLDEEFRNKLRKHTKQEALNLSRALEEEGCADGALTVAIIDGQKILCDGYQTLAMCQEKGIVPSRPRYLPFKNRKDVLEWMGRHQRARRNLTAEEMIENREERIERVVEARQDGESVRTIAAKEGVGKSTIQEDIKEATVRGRTVNPPNGQIKGKDNGRPQPATKKKPAETAKKTDDTLPKSVQNALADTWHASCAAELAAMVRQVKGAISWSYWLDASPLIECLEAAKDYFLTAVPKKACPDCKGQKKIGKEGCKRCRGGGYLASQE